MRITFNVNAKRADGLKLIQAYYVNAAATAPAPAPISINEVDGSEITRDYFNKMNDKDLNAHKAIDKSMPLPSERFRTRFQY